jgi:hypothetical protein
MKNLESLGEILGGSSMERKTPLRSMLTGLRPKALEITIFD